MRRSQLLIQSLIRRQRLKNSSSVIVHLPRNGILRMLVVQGAEWFFDHAKYLVILCSGDTEILHHILRRVALDEHLMCLAQ